MIRILLYINDIKHYSYHWYIKMFSSLIYNNILIINIQQYSHHWYIKLFLSLIYNNILINDKSIVIYQWYEYCCISMMRILLCINDMNIVVYQWWEYCYILMIRMVLFFSHFLAWSCYIFNNRFLRKQKMELESREFRDFIEFKYIWPYYEYRYHLKWLNAVLIFSIKSKIFRRN